MNFLRSFAFALGLVASAGAASACPVCSSDQGVQVRALLREGGWRDLAATLAPVPALLAGVVAVRLATPRLTSGSSDAAARRDDH